MNKIKYLSDIKYDIKYYLFLYLPHIILPILLMFGCSYVLFGHKVYNSEPVLAGELCAYDYSDNTDEGTEVLECILDEVIECTSE